jgi:hypothetical protein
MGISGSGDQGVAGVGGPKAVMDSLYPASRGAKYLEGDLIIQMMSVYSPAFQEPDFSYKKTGDAYARCP